MVPVMYNPMRMLSPRRKLVLQRSKRQRGLAPPRGSGILVDAEWRTAMTRLLKYFGAAGILLAAATISPAQNAATSELHVTVKDPKGAVVTNATVAARDEGKAFERSTTANSDGEYHLIALPPGTYTVTVEAAGFAKAE